VLHQRCDLGVAIGQLEPDDAVTKTHCQAPPDRRGPREVPAYPAPPATPAARQMPREPPGPAPSLTRMSRSARSGTGAPTRASRQILHLCRPFGGVGLASRASISLLAGLLLAGCLHQDHQKNSPGPAPSPESGPPPRLGNRGRAPRRRSAFRQSPAEAGRVPGLDSRDASRSKAKPRLDLFSYCTGNRCGSVHLPVQPRRWTTPDAAILVRTSGEIEDSVLRPGGIPGIQTGTRPASAGDLAECRASPRCSALDSSPAAGAARTSGWGRVQENSSGGLGAGTGQAGDRRAGIWMRGWPRPLLRKGRHNVVFDVEASRGGAGPDRADRDHACQGGGSRGSRGIWRALQASLAALYADSRGPRRSGALGSGFW